MVSKNVISHILNFTFVSYQIKILSTCSYTLWSIKCYIQILAHIVLNAILKVKKKFYSVKLIFWVFYKMMGWNLKKMTSYILNLLFMQNYLLSMDLMFL